MKKTTWIILGVFIVVLVGFLLLQNVENDSTETPEPTSTPAPALRSLDDQDLKAIVLEESGVQTIKLERVDTLEWIVTTHPEGQVTAGNVEEILSYLSNLELISILSSTPPLEEIGLDEPVNTLRFEYDDGTSYTITIGMVTTLNDGYYAQVDDYEMAVVLPMGYIDQVIALIYTATLPPTPTPTVEATESTEITTTPTP